MMRKYLKPNIRIIIGMILLFVVLSFLITVGTGSIGDANYQQFPFAVGGTGCGTAVGLTCNYAWFLDGIILNIIFWLVLYIFLFYITTTKNWTKRIIAIIGAFIFYGLLFFYGLPINEDSKDVQELQSRTILSPYYLNLAKKCKTNKIYFKDGLLHYSLNTCCLDSVSSMANRQGILPTDNGCPEGYRKNGVKCGEDGFVWCEKMKTQNKQLKTVIKNSN